MKILTASQIRQLDAYTIENEPIDSADLMERAAQILVSAFIQEFKLPITIKIFCGLGNNGGDGLCMARLLTQRHCDVEVYICRYSTKCSEDFLLNEQRLKQLSISMYEIKKAEEFPEIEYNDLVFDALFGSGLTRPLTGLTAQLITYLNECECVRLAVDIPSGLMASDYLDSPCFQAQKTYTFQVPKLSFFLPQNHTFVGDFDVLDIGLSEKALEQAETDFHYFTLKEADLLWKKRGKFSHKGTNGHALVLAGSKRMTGAAVLTTKAALKSGAGLVTAYVPQSVVPILQNQCVEAMVWGDKTDKVLSDFPDLSKYRCIAIGPGLGQHLQTQRMLKKLLLTSEKTLVLDADALNLIAKNNWQSLIPKGSILTPHPKELERLVGKAQNDYEQIKILRTFASKIQSIVLLKRAHTVVALPDGKVFFNSTGNPAMGTAGSGDVLTGVLLGLLAQGYKAEEAALLGVYWHGLAGDKAAQQLGRLLAGDLVDFL